MQIKGCRILTVVTNFAPASGPAGGAVVDLGGVTCQADGSDEVSEIDRAAQLHEGNVVVKRGGVVVGMDNDLGHTALHLICIGAILSLSSQEDVP